MAGIGKLARLLVKGRQILRSPAMKKVGTGAKKAGNAIAWPFKKVQDLQTYSSHPTTTGGKIRKGVCKTLDYTAGGLLYGGMLGLVGGAGTICYAGYKDDKSLAVKGLTVASKSVDALAGALAGGLLLGPIGVIAGAALALYTDKSLVSSTIELMNKEAGQGLENVIKQTKHEMTDDVKELLGFSKSETPQAQEVATTETEETKKTASEDVQEETVTPTPAEEETQEEEQVEQTPEQEEETEVPAEQEEQQVQEPEQQEEEEQQPAVEENPPADNLFGGTLNEISIKQYEVQPKDCLWNIAKRELQKANPGKTVTNAHILQQVKEFIRLNPQIKNPDLIYPNQKIKTAA